MSEDLDPYDVAGMAGFIAARIKKENERAADIADGRAEKIRVDRLRLKNVLDFVHFFCVRDSSVMRDQAINGSDIDGGVVVVRERNRSKEDAFLEELRNQGFNVSHRDDYQLCTL